MEEDKALDLHTAARNGYIDIVKCLIENGDDVNLRDDFGETVLMHAVKKGNTDIVNILTEFGANVNAISSGRTALLEKFTGYFSNF